LGRKLEENSVPPAEIRTDASSPRTGVKAKLPLKDIKPGTDDILRNLT
jgi:hypothetical protein